MGPVGMPGISIPGPPGPKVCIPGNIFSFTWIFWKLEWEKIHKISERILALEKPKDII